MKKFIALSIALAVFAISGPVLGQYNPAVDPNSQEAYRIQAESQQRHDDAVMNYQTAKKISLGVFRELRFDDLTSSFDPKIASVGNVSWINGWEMKVSQIIDENNCLIDVASETFWLADYPTGDLSDGDNIRVLDEIVFIENKSFPTVSGSNRTVKAFKLQDRAKQLEAYARKYRKYELRNGKALDFEVKYFDRKTKDFVGEDPSYKEIRLKLMQLTQNDDKQYLREQIEQLTKNAPKPTSKRK